MQTNKLPYGISDFTKIRNEGMVYVDRTRFIAELEEAGRFLFLLRPRRFGKSLMLSTLYAYYDVLYADRFEEWFSGTWIGAHPTRDKNRYLVLYFNFAEVDPDPEQVVRSFDFYTETMFRDFLLRYESRMDEEIANRIRSSQTAADRLSALLAYCTRNRHELCVLIDEYDNFTNTILSTPSGGPVYHALTQQTGVLRLFFNVLKSGTQRPESGLARLFVTGVSPVTMDDVTGGFNIGLQVSLEPRLEKIAGFTRSETLALIAQHGIASSLNMSDEEVLSLMEDWYGGYRFSTSAADPVLNSDMVLYFIRGVLRYGAMPPDLIDHNVRIDYGKLRHLVSVDKKLNGNFSRIRQLLEDGYLEANLKTGFPLERVADEDCFVSLLHYLGLITIRGTSKAKTRLEIPNRTVANLMFGYLREGHEETKVFRAEKIEIEEALTAMAWDGDWQPFFESLGKAVQAQTSVRDYLGSEKVIQGFLLAWLSTSDEFLIHSERELGKGFCDIVLEPFRARYPDLQQGYLIELKYMKRGNLTESSRDKMIAEARTQLQTYASDNRLSEDVRWRCLILVFHGWELAWMSEA